MTTLVHTLERAVRIQPPALGTGGRRALALLALLTLSVAVPGGIHVLLVALSEAYLQVTVFVAATLAMVYGLEFGLKADLSAFLRRHQRWQVPIAALLGATPGCGGAIVAVTQFTRGYMSFGGIVATLTATMGDAMFLLLAKESATGFAVFAIGLFVGIASGYLIDAIHGRNFMRPAPSRAFIDAPSHRRWTPPRLSGAEKLWIGLAIPGTVLGIFGALQFDFDQSTSAFLPFAPGFILGAVGAALALVMWWQRGGDPHTEPCTDGNCHTSGENTVSRTIMNDTNFVTTWVVFAFAGYELSVHVLGIDLHAAFAVWAPIVPLIAIVVGFVPGCGPQIVVTSLYLSGAIPLSAQLGNAISNDGDALLPALAVAPRAALLATLYSAAPALVVAYGYFFIFE